MVIFGSHKGLFHMNVHAIVYKILKDFEVKFLFKFVKRNHMPAITKKDSK